MGHNYLFFHLFGISIWYNHQHRFWEQKGKNNRNHVLTLHVNRRVNALYTQNTTSLATRCFAKQKIYGTLYKMRHMISKYTLYVFQPRAGSIMHSIEQRWVTLSLLCWWLAAVHWTGYSHFWNTVLNYHSHSGDIEKAWGFGAGENFLGLFPVTLLKSLLKMEQLLQ